MRLIMGRKSVVSWREGYRNFTRLGTIAETEAGTRERRYESHPFDRRATARLAAPHPQSERWTAHIPRPYQSFRRGARRARRPALAGAARWRVCVADLFARSGRA